jgi:DNA-directed RNA polymerase II subunit RPB1
MQQRLAAGCEGRALTLALPLQKKYSVVHVTHAGTMVNGEPKEGGLADLRMGSSERFVVCTTDGMDREEGCPGYFGHIELATPLFHIGFNRVVLKVLRCVGYHSSKLLLDPSNVKDAAVLGMLSKTVMGPARLDRAMKACMSKKLDFNSGAMQPKYKLEPKGRINIIAEFPAPKATDMEEATDIKMERTQVSIPLLLHVMRMPFARSFAKSHSVPRRSSTRAHSTK